MRKAAALLLAGALILGSCGCGEVTPPPTAEIPQQSDTPVLPQTKEFSLAYDPHADLHPITGDSPVNRLLIFLVYDSLYEPDENFTFHPVLAADAQVDESGLVWTITPAEGVVFSDGTPLEARHVTTSLNTARKSSFYGQRLSAVTSVRTSGNTVVITLSEPNGALPSLLDIPIVLEQENGMAPLGTGRYHYVLTEDAVYLETDRPDLPYQTIPLCPVSGTEQRIAAFESGAVSAVTADYFSPYALGYSCTYEAWDYTTTDLLYVGFRTTDGPCSSALIRRAFSMAFDRSRIVTDLLDGHGTPTSLPVPPEHTEWDERAATLLNYDIESASELLEEAGCVLKEDGLLYYGKSPLTVTLLVNGDNSAKVAAAEELARSLDMLGVTVTVSSLPWADYTKALKQCRFDLYIGEVRLTGDFDVTSLLSGSLNYGGYDSAPILERLTAWKTAWGTERTWMAKFLWLVFAEETPFAPLCFGHEALLVHWNSVRTLSPTRNDPFRNMEDWILHE